jgi:release factor glutamine methyltransferase
MSTIQELYTKAKSLLENYPDAAIESKVLVLKSLAISEEEFYSHPDRRVSESKVQQFYGLVLKRQHGTPLAYVVGEKEFWSLLFKVTPGVLIPRPETELLVEKVIELSSGGKELIVDIGTGAGNIAVSIAKDLTQARIVATDVSQQALKKAKINADLQKVPRIEFVRGSLFVPLRKLELQGKCDFIVSNPPYVSEEEWETLSEEIKNHEPKRALVAGKNGLEFIKRLIQQAPAFLGPGGYLCLEMGWNQKEKVLSFFGSDWQNPVCYCDLNNIPRVVIAQPL